MIELIQDGPDVLMPVKVVPGASRDRIAGQLDGALKVTVSAPPERGAANKSVCKLIAKTLGLRRSQVAIDAGNTTPRKTIRITDTTPQDIRSKLPE